MDENNPIKKEPYSPQGQSPMGEVYGYKKEEGESQKPAAQNQNNGSTDNGKKGYMKGFLGFIWEILKIVIVALIIVLPIRYFVFQPFIVKGDSMVPTLHSGDYLIVDEISYRFESPQRGDIVVLKYPLDTTQDFIKRVIGLPGETVEIQNGVVDILDNGKQMQLNEYYLPSGLDTSGNIDVTLKANQYFVLGDNRPYSYDSRMWGILPKSDIIGKAVLRVFPFQDMTYIKTPTY